MGHYGVRRRGRRAAFGVGVGVLFGAASADAACPLELVPADASPAWKSAARVAERRLATSPTQDCASVEVAVRPSGGALLTFITTDGRRAVRALMSPEDIAPSLAALLETLPSETPRPEPPPSMSSPAEVAQPPASPSVGGAASPPGTRVAATPAAAAVPVTPAAPSPEVHFIIGGSAGVRLGLGGAYATPAFALRPSGTFGAWELSGTVEYDPSYSYLPGGLPPGFKLWSFVAGLQVGRREEIGGVSLGYGLGLGVASIREEVDDASGTAKVADFGQPRAAAYGRLVLPRRARVRATFELGLDGALANFRKKATLRNDLPELPRWGILFSVGVETSAL